MSIAAIVDQFNLRADNDSAINIENRSFNYGLPSETGPSMDVNLRFILRLLGEYGRAAKQAYQRRERRRRRA